MLAQRTNAIYGDANAQTATVVPDLSKASDGSSLRVGQNTADLDFNQTLELNDLFYETTTEEIYPQSTAAGNCAIIGNTMGWTRLDQMILEMEVTLSGGFQTSNPTTGALGTLNTAITQPGWYNTPAFAMINGLQRFDVSMGNNNQKIGRQQMTYIQGLILTAQDQKYDHGKIKTLGHIGMPRSRCCNDIETNQTGFAKPFFNRVTTTSQEHLQAWQNALVDYIIAANGASVVSSEPTMTGTLRIGVPLSLLNSFFKNPAYLPPGTPYRFEIQYLTTPFYILSVQSGVINAAANNTLLCTHTGNFRLVYRRHELRQPSQAQINQQWLTRPFLYNYETYEYYEKATDGTTINYVQDIAISQQRPTEIIIKVIWTGSLTTPSTVVSNTLANIVWPNNGAGMIACDDLKIYIAGRQQYYLRTCTQITQQVRAEGRRDATNVLNNLVNNETYCVADGEFDAVISNTFSNSEEFWLKISINPGDMQKHGFLSTDQGAVVIRVDGDFHFNNSLRTPLPVNFKIVYYKKLPEQITLDANKNITTVTWPAVKSNSGYLIEQTFNNN